MPVYFLECETNGLIKIGFVNKIEDANRRLRALQLLSPVPVRLLGISALDYDKTLHQKFNHLRHHGEWFEPGQDLLDYIQQKSADLASLSKVEMCKGTTLKGTPCLHQAYKDGYCRKHTK